MRGHIREEAAGRLARVQPPLDARRGTRWSAKVRGGRAIAVGWLRRSEGRGAEHQRFVPKSNSDEGSGPAGAVLRGDRQAGRGGEVAQGTGGGEKYETRPGTTVRGFGMPPARADVKATLLAATA